MDASLRIVTKTPLQELWRSDGSSLESCQKALSSEDIRELLRAGAVEFVIADPGSALKWIPVAECHAFWKKVAKTRVAGPTNKVRREEFPVSTFILRRNGVIQNPRARSSFSKSTTSVFCCQAG